MSGMKNIAYKVLYELLTDLTLNPNLGRILLNGKGEEIKLPPVFS